jgi:hypothetical protein
VPTVTTIAACLHWYAKYSAHRRGISEFYRGLLTYRATAMFLRDTTLYLKPP